MQFLLPRRHRDCLHLLAHSRLVAGVYLRVPHLEDIFVVAGWASSHTYIRFYQLNVDFCLHLFTHLFEQQSVYFCVSQCTSDNLAVSQQHAAAVFP